MPGRVKSRSRHLVCPVECDSKNSSADENVSTANPNCFSKCGNDSRTDTSSSITDTSGVPVNTVMRVSRHSQLQAEWHQGRGQSAKLSFPFSSGIRVQKTTATCLLCFSINRPL